LSDLVGRVMGNKYGLCVEVFVSLLQICFSVGYVIVILRLAGEVLPDVSQWAVVGVVLALVTAMAFIRHLRDLWWVSFLGIFIVIVGMIGVTTVTGIINFSKDYARIPFWGDTFLGARSSGADLVSHMGSLLYSVEAINHVMPNANAMTHPKQLPTVISFALGTYGLLVGSFMLFAAQAGFGKCAAGGSILLDCLPDGAIAIAAKTAVIVQMLASFPVTMFPAMEMLEERLFYRRDTAAEALVADDEQPYTYMHEDPSTPSAMKEVDEAHKVGKVDNGHGNTCSWPRLFRIAVFIVTVFIALAIPDFETFTGLIGSLLLSTLGFLLPIILYEKVRISQNEPPNIAGAAVHVFIVLLGSVVAVVGTYNSIRTALKQ